MTQVGTHSAIQHFVRVRSEQLLQANDDMEDQNSINAGNVTGTVSRDSQSTSLDEISRASKVNSFALETFGELNHFWGNAARFLLPLSEQFEEGLLALLRKMSPQLFGDLKPSDIAIEAVTRPPDRSDALIREVLGAALLSLAEENFTD